MARSAIQGLRGGVQRLVHRPRGIAHSASQTGARVAFGPATWDGILPLLIGQVLSLSLHAALSGVLAPPPADESGASTRASSASVARQAPRLLSPSEVRPWLEARIDRRPAEPQNHADAVSQHTSSAAELAPQEPPQDLQPVPAGLSPSRLESPVPLEASSAVGELPAESSTAPETPPELALAARPAAEPASASGQAPPGVPAPAAPPGESLGEQRPELSEALPEAAVQSPAASPSAAPDAPPRLVDLGAQDLRSLLLSGNLPNYPLVERRQGHTGVVLVLLELGSDGRVVSAQVQSSSGRERLDQAALEAVRGWVFDRRSLRDRGVEDRLTLPIRFELRRG